MIISGKTPNLYIRNPIPLLYVSMSPNELYTAVEHDFFTMHQFCSYIWMQDNVPDMFFMLYRNKWQNELNFSKEDTPIRCRPQHIIQI